MPILLFLVAATFALGLWLFLLFLVFHRVHKPPRGFDVLLKDA